MCRVHVTHLIFMSYLNLNYLNLIPPFYLKFDIQKPEVDIDFKKGSSKVLLAGSTHKGEDEIILFTYRKLKENHSNLKLIIAPRHLTRTEEVRALTESFGYKYDFRSSGKCDLNDIDVLIMDTLGELGKMYAFADVAFIGGSFNKTGGHNPSQKDCGDYSKSPV